MLSDMPIRVSASIARGSSVRMGLRTRRKWTALAFTTLLLIVLCAICVKKVDAYKRLAVAVADDDEEDEEDDDEFDFMSAKLSIPSKQDAVEEVSCGDAGTGECAAPGVVRSVFDRGLVTHKPRAKEILKEHARSATDSKRAYGGEVLGYVTPWNGRGYDFAKQFRRKFDFISPVWLQIREDGKTKTPVITGTHDIDRQWVSAVRGSDGDGPKVVPRVMYERNRLSSGDVPVVIEALLTLAEKEKFDGFVFEIPVVAGTMDLLLRVGKAFQEKKKLLLLVLTRSSNDGRLPVTPELMDQLLPLVHRFTMNAYDYQTPGPNAPIDWIETTLQRFRAEDRAKILMGLPFYGYDNNDAIVGTTYIEQLQRDSSVKIRWDAAAHECFYQYTAPRDGFKHTVYYPCLQFLQDRLELFQENGVAGAAIWELGQGLEFFHDVL